MNTIWMMWANGDKSKPPAESVLEAMAYYQDKYGERPNRVRAPLNFPKLEVEGILIERTQIVRVDHLLLTTDKELVIPEGREA